MLKRHFWEYAFLTPALVLLALFEWYPVAGSLRLAFYRWDGTGPLVDWVGLRNFIDVARDPFFWRALYHNFVYTAFEVPIQLFLALVLALFLSSTRVKSRDFLRALYFTPVVTSAAVLGVVLSMLFHELSHPLNALLLKLGDLTRPLDLLGNPRTAFPVVILVGIWQLMGQKMVYFLAGLQAIPEDLYEAARVDGADHVQQFVHITLPGLSGVGVVILMLSVLGSLAVFDSVLTLTGGGPYFSSEVMSTYIYSYAFTSAHGVSDSNLGYAAATSVFMSVLIMGITAAVLAARSARHKGEAA